MQKLTKEARAYCLAAANEMSREELVQELENICIACYDEETIEEDFAPSFVDSVEAGDIEFDFNYSSAGRWSHPTKMLCLDIDEVWEPRP